MGSMRMWQLRQVGSFACASCAWRVVVVGVNGGGLMTSPGGGGGR